MLPVLPLRDTVVFPDTMIPLTIGQERTIKLIDDVLAGDRLLALVTSRDAEVETPGPDLLYPVGTVGLAHKMIKLPDGTMRILVQGLQRVRVKEYVSEEPYLVARTEKIEDVVTRVQGVGRPARQPAGRVQQDRRAGAVPARGARDGRGQRRGARAAHLPHRQHHAHQGRGQAGAARGERRRAAHAQAHRHPHARARRPGAGLQDPERRARRDRQEPARVLPAPAAARHPAGARRDRRAGSGDQRAAPEGRGADAPGGGRQGGPPGARPPQQHLAAERRVSGHPHLPRLDHHAAVERPQRGQPRRGARPRDPGPRPLRPREGQGPHPRVPRGAQAQGRPARADPVLRRPARRGQDEPRPQHRRGDGPQVRAHQRRRRARRGRDPRASPHVRGRDARHHRARHARRRHQQPAVHDRRDRQDGRRLARRSVERDARGAGPGAEHHLPRPLHGPAVRPQPGPLHHHGQPARAHPRAAARPHGDHQPRRLHDRGEAPHREERTWCRGRSRPTASSRDRSRSRTRRIVEIISSYTREAGVRNVEREIGTICRKLAREVAEASNGSRKRFTVNAEARARPARPAARLQRRQAAHQRPGRGHRPRLDAGGRRHPLHRGHGDARQRPPHSDRPARRRDEGVGDGGA